MKRYIALIILFTSYMLIASSHAKAWGQYSHLVINYKAREQAASEGYLTRSVFIPAGGIADLISVFSINVKSGKIIKYDKTTANQYDYMHNLIDCERNGYNVLAVGGIMGE